MCDTKEIHCWDQVKHKRRGNATSPISNFLTKLFISLLKDEILHLMSRHGRCRLFTCAWYSSRWLWEKIGTKHGKHGKMGTNKWRKIAITCTQWAIYLSVWDWLLFHDRRGWKIGTFMIWDNLWWMKAWSTHWHATTQSWYLSYHHILGGSSWVFVLPVFCVCGNILYLPVDDPVPIATDECATYAFTGWVIHHSAQNG